MTAKQKLTLFERALRSYGVPPAGVDRGEKPTPEQYGLTTPGERCVAEAIQRKVAAELDRKPF